MLTPEIQNYITQSRSAGMSDAQIRQNLTMQGWSQADLDQAFGVAAGTVQTSGKSSASKIITVTVILLVLLALLFWGAMLGYGYWKYKLSGVKITDFGNSGQTSDSKRPLNCDEPRLDSTGLGQLSPIIPPTWPSDIPTYPGSKLLGSSSLTFGGGTTQFSSVAYCSKDSVDQIANFFINSNSGWKFTKELTQSKSNIQTSGQSIIVVGKKSGPDGVIIGISTTGNGADTLIYEQFGGSVPK